MQVGDDKFVDKMMVIKWFLGVVFYNKVYREWEGFYYEIFNEFEREVVFKVVRVFID